MKKAQLQAKYIFIAPPSLTELEHRLRGRSNESAEKIKQRLETAVKEIAYSETPDTFDLVIVNHHLEESFQQLIRSLQKWFPELDMYRRK